MFDQEEKPLSEWRAELKRNGKNHWLRFYAALVGTPVSSNPRFYKALKLYGEWPMFEAIVASSGATLTGDPLNYVLKVCSNKWKEMQQDADEEDEYIKEIERIKEASHKQNEEMAAKLKKVSKS
jgi:hypothetical protein